MCVCVSIHACMPDQWSECMRVYAVRIVWLAYVWACPDVFVRLCVYVGECAHVFVHPVCALWCVHWLASQLMCPVIQQWACCGLVAGSRGWESHSRLQLSLAGREARMPSLFCLHTGWSLKVCVCVYVCLVGMMCKYECWMDVCFIFNTCIFCIIMLSSTFSFSNSYV